MGKVMMSGVAPQMKAPVISGILASDLAVGSVVKLMENGVAIEYLVVNQGKPSGSSLYDDSCDGTWLLRKDIHSNRAWDSTNNDYKNSDIHAWLNGDFFNTLGNVEKKVIKQIKIPYVNGTGGSAIASGTSGLSCKVFLLSGYELGWTTSSHSSFPIDGSCLSYFSGTAVTDSKRIAKLNNTASIWWTRSPQTTGTDYPWRVHDSGCFDAAKLYSWPSGVRQSVILPSTAVFDETTMLLKGVS